jgi:hypothetical protein
LLATKASQPASPNSYSVLGSTLETIHSKVVATLDVLGGRIGADKKVVKFVTQESKIHTTTLTLSLGWQAFFEPAIHLQSKLWPTGVGLTLNPMTSLSYYNYYYIQTRPQVLSSTPKTLVHSVFKPSVGVGAPT